MGVGADIASTATFLGPDSRLKMHTMSTEPNKPEPAETPVPKADTANLPKEIGGQKGPEPTRYGDWEKNGRCTDF